MSISNEDRIEAAINIVYNTLGSGLTETIYRKALVIQLSEEFQNIQVEKSIPIIYNNIEIAVLRADIVIDNEYILELKSISSKLSSKEELQLKRYMNILDISTGFLVNFGKELEFKECNA